MIAGVGMGNMIMNMIGMSVIIGINGALETLCSQSYGANNLRLCGIYLNRSRFVLLMCFIPISLILL